MPIIRVSGLSYQYPTRAWALRDVSLEIEASERIGLIGPNGAGKTTLFLTLAGVLAAPPGVIEVGGLDPARPGDRALLPARLGIIFQDSDDQLFNSSVAEDVAFGPLNLGLDRQEVERRVRESIDRVSLRGLEQRPPHQLSGGEKRRAALAGVLAMRPEILLLDEPSQHLDPRGRRELIELLNSLEGTRIIASHELEFIVATCGRVIVLDGGNVIADGPMRTILTDRALLHAHGLEVPHSLTYHAPGSTHHEP